MTTPSRVVAATIVSDGLPAYQRDESQPSPLAACAARWEHRQEELRDKKWAECPPEMTADFVRSMALEFKANDGDKASQRACLFVASLMAEKDAKRLELAARCPAFNTSIDLSVSIGPASPALKDQAVFELDVAAAASEEEVRQALGDFAASTPQPQFFDAITHTPDAQLAQLVARAERVLEVSSYETLVVAAMGVLVWDQMERTNSAHIRLELRGLFDETGDLLPEGTSAVMQATTQGLSFVSDAAPDNTARSRATVRLPRP